MFETIKSGKRVRQASTPITSREYGLFIDGIKAKIRTAQVKAALAVNAELVRLYWDIGNAVIERQQANGWGSAVIAQMSRDIQKDFPGIEGFSDRNIWRMRAFYLAWTKECAKLPQPVAEIDGMNLPQCTAEIPWGHNIVLLEQVKDPLQRVWYIFKTIEFGWSRVMLVHQIEGDAYARHGKALTNFKTTLPPLQSDLARQIIKDPYNFDFLTLKDDCNERLLETALIDEIQKFLLELGAGFAFIGRQVPLTVGSKNYFLDLLFYHVKLHCYIILELKTVDFEPEHAGKLNFYIKAVDSQWKASQDQPTIGIIICKNKEKVDVEYALSDIYKPIGVSEYKLTQSLPKSLKTSLPTIKSIENELSKSCRKYNNEV